MYRIGIDLGGTTIKAGVVDENFRVLSSCAMPTASELGAEALVRQMIDLAEKAAAQARIPMEQIEAFGLGVPGTANRRTGLMEYANNLCFENEPLPDMLRQHFGRPVRFTNDANAAAWGEYLAGCGRGSRSMVMVTLGTGIGGGIILDGKLYEGCNYAAGEFGHFTIKYDGRRCACGRRGCFEAYASASALARMARQAVKSPAGRESLLLKLCEGDAGRIDGAMVFAAKSAGDGTAEKVTEKYLHYLSIGITDLINIFQPEILCIGGGLSQAGEALLAPLRELTNPGIYTRTSKVNTRILSAALGNQAGIIGAAMLED